MDFSDSVLQTAANVFTSISFLKKYSQKWQKFHNVIH